MKKFLISFLLVFLIPSCDSKILFTVNDCSYPEYRTNQKFLFNERDLTQLKQMYYDRYNQTRISSCAFYFNELVSWKCLLENKYECFGYIK